MGLITPLGAYTRGTPDWFRSVTCAGFGFWAPGDPGSEPAVGLYNDDVQGRSLLVYGIGAYSDNGEEVVNFSFFQGPCTSLYHDGGIQTIDPLAPSVPGKIYTGLTAAQAATDTVANQLGLYILGAQPPSSFYAPIDHIMGQNPLAIVRPGYTFAGWGYTFGLGVHFYYTALKYN